MDSIGLIVVIIGQTAVIAFGAGKLWQKVSDLVRRTDRIEKILDKKETK